MRIDLGSGRQKHTDCIGIDAAPFPCTDIVCDFGRGIPLENDSVDFVMACRSLEYVTDFKAAMSEIYRVCRHKAVVCIVAPYAQSALHIANPDVKTQFNEYTPYYLTPRRYHEVLIPELDITPVNWIEEDPRFDFRLLRMEFFYFADYLSPMYESHERQLLLQTQLNVVDEIMYHFAVVKETLTESDWHEFAVRPLEEPLRITERRNRDSLLDTRHLQPEYPIEANKPSKEKPPERSAKSNVVNNKRLPHKMMQTSRNRHRRNKRT